MIDLWQMERELKASGYQTICGVDEAGRGPLVGPVVAAAVILPEGLDIGVDDSKKLKEAERDALYDEIIAKAVGYGIGMASVEEIDAVNILNATYLAMNRAIEALCRGAHCAPACVNAVGTTNNAAKRLLAGEHSSPLRVPDLCLIDGNLATGVTYPNLCVVKGDSKCASIAAASILAKVTRDRLMVELHEVYPQYGFDRHKGYPTKAHYAALDAHGVSAIHRESFLRKWREARV